MTVRVKVTLNLFTWSSCKIMQYQVYLTSDPNIFAIFLKTSGATFGTLSQYSPNNHRILALAIGTYLKYEMLRQSYKQREKNLAHTSGLTENLFKDLCSKLTLFAMSLKFVKSFTKLLKLKNVVAYNPFTPAKHQKQRIKNWLLDPSNCYLVFSDATFEVHQHHKKF